jgi:hypothetical protein
LWEAFALDGEGLPSRPRFLKEGNRGFAISQPLKELHYFSYILIKNIHLNVYFVPYIFSLPVNSNLIGAYEKP